jgi:hypothetical protein
LTGTCPLDERTAVEMEAIIVVKKNKIKKTKGAKKKYGIKSSIVSGANKARKKIEKKLKINKINKMMETTPRGPRIG